MCCVESLNNVILETIDYNYNLGNFNRWFDVINFIQFGFDEHIINVTNYDNQTNFNIFINKQQINDYLIHIDGN